MNLLYRIKPQFVVEFLSMLSAAVESMCIHTMRHSLHIMESLSVGPSVRVLSVCLLRFSFFFARLSCRLEWIILNVIAKSYHTNIPYNHTSARTPNTKQVIHVYKYKSVSHPSKPCVWSAVSFSLYVGNFNRWSIFTKKKNYILI